MTDEPDPDRQHIFDDLVTAQEFYDALVLDLSLTDDQRSLIKPPRQSHRNTWVMDKVR